MPTNCTDRRIVVYDVLRVIAICAVVMIHTAGTYVSVAASHTTWEFLCGNFLDSLARIGVPVFIMLSGALMLDEQREMPFSKVMRHVRTTAFLLVIWSLIYAVLFYIAAPLLTHHPIRWEKFVSNFVFGHYHMWFLYMLIGLYLLIPVLRLFVKKTNAKTVLYLIVLSVAFQFLPYGLNAVIAAASGTDVHLMRFVDQFELGFAGGGVGYFLLGWYVTHVEIKKSHRIGIYVVGILGFLTMWLGVQFLATDSNGLTNKLYSFYGISVMSYGLAFFVLVYYALREKTAARFPTLVTTLSRLSFGVYIVHALILTAVQHFVTVDRGFLEIVAEWALTIVLSYVIVFVMSKIPLLQKLVRS